MTFVQNPIPTYSEAQMLTMLPPSGGLYFFYDTDKENNLYSVDSAGTFTLVSDNEDDCCTCEITSQWMCTLGEALNRGIITSDAYQTAIASGLHIASTNTGSGNCTISISTNFSAPTSVVITETEVAMRTGGSTHQLTGYVLPNTADQRLLWTTSASATATVDQTGRVTSGSLSGTAVITAYSIADPTKFATCSVVVS